MKLNNGNEKFFKDLATAYVNRDGERLKKEDLPHVANFATDGLDEKLKAKMAPRKKRNVRNWTIAMSTLAAGFLMFLIFSAVIPTYRLHDDDKSFFEAPAAMEPVPESEPMVESAQEPTDTDFDGNDDWLFSLDYVGAEEGAEAEVLPPEAEDAYDIGFVAAWFHIFVDVLPEAFHIDRYISTDDLQVYHISTPENQLIVITEVFDVPAINQADAQSFELEGVTVFRQTLETGEYQLSFSQFESNYVIVGEEIQAVMLVTEALIYSLDTSHQAHEPEQMMDLKLPRGLISIVPLF